MRDKVFDISHNGIKQRIEHINQMLEEYDMSIKDFLDGTENKSLECFFDVVTLNGGCK